MFRFFFLAVFILISSASAQNNDTVKIIIPADTLDADTLSSADSLALADTTGFLSDSINISKADTINPIYQKAFYQYSRFINKRDFYRRNYNNTADIFNYSSFAFTPPHGLAGYPDNMMLFGTGSLSNSFLVNGMNYNDYSGLPMDLNRISTEYIDSAEVLPLPRGFLYGLSNNTGTVNFIGRDFISIAPFTRIKYSEGPYGEGFIDGMFNSIIFSRLNMLVNITNRKADERFLNSGSDYSEWSGRVQLKYLLNNNINLFAGYHYNNTNSGAGGGIDIFNLRGLQNGFYEAIYDERLASVSYPGLRFNTYTNSLFLKSIASFGKFSFTDLSFYYRFNRIEMNGPFNDSTYLDNLFRNKISGFTLNQNFNWSVFNLNFLASGESAEIINDSGLRGSVIRNNQNYSNWSAAGIFSLQLFNSMIVPSVFYKLNKEKISETVDYSGYGADLKLNLPLNSGIYAGYSESESRFFDGKSKNFQAGISYDNPNFKADINYFSSMRSPVQFGTDSILKINSPFYYPPEISGIGMEFEFLIKQILLEGKVDYYRAGNSDYPSVLPSIDLVGGVYYKDSLFSGNLDLKTGINLYYYGRRNLPLSRDEINIFGDNTAGPDFRLDFLLSGEIQARAIVFFTWENILDRQYFFIPFYPMPPSGIRFGVSWILFN